ncbi:gliding motility lipoprotein GldD [Spirosoma sp. KCTC 42546]|uniref:gliding motility lipoprotein GldD n=1 Tax=Spirosoma sp. KCTC 42546 TaxID=2520506 RepID=UPI001159D1A0|nr:gliding motility lipoprotein GldD [Spirosoma sp. KCTC 42546]QDK83062.1 gliding motility lipoprotein GldD [Spirosoma sp. KCTC 42546]
MQKYSIALIIGLLLTACGSSSSDNYVPKPKGFPRLDLPTPSYTLIDPTHPYQFEYNKIARILPDTFARAERDWIFINYPTFHASVQLTYKPIHNDVNRLRAMLEDSYKLAARHNIKAYAIEQRKLRLKSGLEASVIDLSGEVPSQVQFVTTDSTTHFLRGALYFNTATENDSLQPVIQYIRKDILHLLNTLKWKK